MAHSGEKILFGSVGILRIDQRILECLFSQDLFGFCLLYTSICVLAPFSVPIGPVPISLTNLAIYFALYLLGMVQGLSLIHI